MHHFIISYLEDSMSRSVKATVNPDLESISEIKFVSNRVLTAYPSILMFIPVSIIRQYTRPLSLYFLIIGGLLFIREIAPYDPMSQLIPVFLVLSIAVFRETMQELDRQREDKRINTQKTRVNRAGNWLETNWEDVVVGDVVMVDADLPAPADLVMVASSSSGNTAYIQTTNLDGETNYKSRSGVEKALVAIDMMTKGIDMGYERAEIIIHAEAPRSDLDWFEGQAVFQFTDPEKGRAMIDNVRSTQSNLSEGEMTGTSTVRPDSPSSQKLQVERLSIRNFIPREAVVRGTDWIIGVAVYTGTDSKVMLGNDRPAYKTSKIDRMTDKLVAVILFLQFSLSIFIGTAGGLSGVAVPRWWIDMALSESSIVRGLLDGLAAIILITQMIPISLIISLEIAKVYQAKLMEADVAMPGMRAPSQALNDDLGQIGYVLSDKTGTLTSNELVLKVATVHGKAYPDLTSLRSAAKTNPNAAMFRDALSICHDVAPNWSSDIVSKSKSEITQSITDLRKEAKKHRSVMEESSGHITPVDDGGQLPLGMSYCGASPDEICFVTACAAHLGIVLHKRSHGEMVFTEYRQGQPREFTQKILRMFEFDNARRRSSVVVMGSDSKSVTVFVKGSDDGMLDRCLSETEEEKLVLKETEASLNFYAKQSLRTLVFASKTMSLIEWESLVNRYQLDAKGLMEEVESRLTLLGCTGTEDRLQDGVPGCIQRMRIAGIAVWMITGDKLDTAIEISKNANLIGAGMRIVTIDLGTEELAEEKLIALEKELSLEGVEVAAVVTGRSIRYYEKKTRFITALLKCKSVVVCRSTKDQKALMVELVQRAVNREVLVLGIGDGANDVPMIKKADVGIGIAGKEGRQAAQNADYTITQFSHLDRLLQFHGRLNYVRTSKMVLYFIFKNLVLCLPFVVHSAIVSMYSSSALISSSMGLSFNTFLTAMPVFALGLVERDVSPNDHLIGFSGIKAHDLAQAYPRLYMTGRNNHMFGRYLLGTMFVSAVMTGCWIYLSIVGPLVSSAVSWTGWVADHWGVSDLYFFAVFLVDSAAVFIISEGVTWPMAITLFYSLFSAITFLISNAYDAANPGGVAFFELIRYTIIMAPTLLIAAAPPVLLGIAAKNWKFRFDPTARMIWQEAKERADLRRAAMKKMDSSPKHVKSTLSNKYKSMFQSGKSVFFNPDELDPLMNTKSN